MLIYAHKFYPLTDVQLIREVKKSSQTYIWTYFSQECEHIYCSLCNLVIETIEFGNLENQRGYTIRNDF